jgi:hypothetical protein
MSAECAAPFRRADPGRYSPRQPESYSLYLHGAVDEDSIPQENREAWDRGGCSVSTMEVWESPATPAGGPWEARLEWGTLAGSRDWQKRQVEYIGRYGESIGTWVIRIPIRPERVLLNPTPLLSS